MKTEIRSNHINDLKFLLALSFIEDIGPVTTGRLLSAFHTPEAVFSAGLSDLSSAGEISPLKAKRIKEFNAWDRIEREIEKAEHHNIRIVTLFDKEYPEPLSHLDNAPPILYIKGDLVEEDRFALAMVGSRDMSESAGKSLRTCHTNLLQQGLQLSAAWPGASVGVAAELGPLKDTQGKPEVGPYAPKK